MSNDHFNTEPAEYSPARDYSAFKHYGKIGTVIALILLLALVVGIGR